MSTTTDHEALLEIQTLLDGVEWETSTLDEIAQILIRAGYRVRDLNDKDLPEEEDDNPFHHESPEGRAWDCGDRSFIE